LSVGSDVDLIGAGNKVHFQTRVVERNVVVLGSAYVELANLATASATKVAHKSTAV
jgi:hypothetical protein